MPNRAFHAVLALVVLAGSASAGDFSFTPAFTSADFEQLAESLGDAIAFPNLRSAAPSGVLGFEVIAVAGGPRVDSASHWWRNAVDGSTVGGTLLGGHLVVRKGLPAGLDLGVQIGQVKGERFWGGELRWALLAGGLVGPSLALRGSYSRLDNAPFDLEVAEVQAVVSKSLALVTPYAAVGVEGVRGSAVFGDPIARRRSVRKERLSAAAGLRLNLLPFHVVGELRRGYHVGYFVGVGLGL
jgi:hypothetical protein